ncbi:MAG: hypothetical protein Q8878_03125, partial [Bacillota bacterium]|nr:hypothetical protein [Bacillota bacterium]
LNAVIGREQAKFLLSEFENFQYYKDDSPGIQVEITKFMETVKNLPEGMFKGFFTGTNGNDMHDDYLRGATGFMPGLHLADSKEAGWRLLEAGEYSKALEMQMKLTPLYCFERLYQLDVCKQILKRRGVIFNTKSRRANMTVFNAPAEKEFNRIYDRLKTAAQL